jgi:hypothetical protein
LSCLGPGPYGSSCPKGLSERSGEARSDPRSAAGLDGIGLRFEPGRPPIRDRPAAITSRLVGPGVATGS